jgi:hypothetical protein
MIISICILIALILQPFLLFWMVNRVISREKRQIQARIDALVSEWFVAPEGEPHKAARVLDAAGTVVGSAAARSIMGTLGQRASSATMVANIASDNIQGQANPLMALLAGGMGRKAGKGAALMHLAELIGPMLKGNGNGNTSQSEAPSSGSFTL